MLDFNLHACMDIGFHKAHFGYAYLGRVGY